MFVDLSHHVLSTSFLLLKKMVGLVVLF
ncbi:UNVERIFIED_CONTAM: hypothetical protein GTU68_049288 [Idotea baltica]|nr:hypothetical protein [Idotea baltica]